MGRTASYRYLLEIARIYTVLRRWRHQHKLVGVLIYRCGFTLHN